MPVTRAAPDPDVVRLDSAVIKHFKLTAANYNTSQVRQALNNAGITKFDDEFLMMTDKDFQDLKIEDPNNAAHTMPLPTGLRSKLRSLKSFYHSMCYRAQADVDIASFDTVHFDKFRTSMYDPEAPIKPWRTIPLTDEHKEEVYMWKRQVRPSKSDYKEFRDETTWIRAKERFKTTVQSHSLEHLIDDTHVPTNLDLDESQRNWLYKVLQDVMQAPVAKSIVTNHLADKNTREIWKEICAHYDTSMSSTLRAQQISTYLTSTRLHTCNWNGKQANFIVHWKTVARDYNEISAEAFTDAQLITFLNAALSGTPGLSNVLQLNNSARKAAGNRDALRYEDYIQLLLDQAQVHDGANIRPTNPRARRSANVHEFEYQDDHEDIPFSYEAEVHDIDTPIEHITVLQTDQYRRNGNTKDSSRSASQPRKVRVDFATWNKLTKQDQDKWDDVSESGKSTLLTYAAKNPDKYLQVSELPNVHKSAMMRVSQKSQDKRSLNNHELLFEDEEDDKIDVQTHERDLISFEKPISQEKKIVPNLLEMATQKTKKVDFTASNMDINHVLSASKKKSPQVSVHEQYMPRSVNTPYEINVHRFQFLGETLEIPSPDASDNEDDKATQGNVQTSEVATLPSTTQETPEATTDFIDYFSPGAFDEEALKKHARKETNVNFFDFLTPEEIKDPRHFRKNELEEQESDKKLPGDPKYMSGIFSKVEKPVPMKDRIQPNSDGDGFEYSPIASDDSPLASDGDFGSAMNEEESEGQLEDINLESLQIATEEDDEDDPDMPSMVPRYRSDSEDDEPYTNPFGFPILPSATALPTETTDTFDTSGNELKSPSETMDMFDASGNELEFAKPKSKKDNKKKKRYRKKKQGPKPKPSIAQTICQLVSPRQDSESSSSGSNQTSSTNKSLAAKSDTSKKSANSFSALTEEQDFRPAESG